MLGVRKESVKKRVRHFSSEDDAETKKQAVDEVANTKTKSTKAKAGKRKVSDSESDSEEVPVVPIVQSPVRSKRSGKKVR